MRSKLSCFVVAFVFLLGSSAGLRAEDKKPIKPEKGTASVDGQVKKVDDKANTIILSIVTQKGQPAEDQTFTLAADAKVFVAGTKEAKLSDVQVGKNAQLQLDAAKKVTVVAQGGGGGDKGNKGEKVPGIGGQVKKVDDKANTITLSVVTQKGQPAEDQTFTLAADAKFIVPGNKEAKLSDIKADAPAQLQLNADKKVVVVAQGGGGDKGNKGEKTPGVNGQVKKIDDKANTITLSVVTQKGQPAEDQTFTIAADARFMVAGNKEAKLADIKVDAPAQLMLNADKKVIGVAQGGGDKGNKGEKAPGVSGQVKKVDDKAHTITLSVVTQKGQPAEDQTFTLAADAKIMVEGKEAKLSEVAADKLAYLSLNADKKVVMLAQGKGQKPNK